MSLPDIETVIVLAVTSLLGRYSSPRGEVRVPSTGVEKNCRVSNPESDSSATV